MNTTQTPSRLILGLSLLLAMLLAGCASSATSSTSHPTMAPPFSTTPTTSGAHVRGTITRTLRLADAPAACPIDASWSPSGGQIAVLATRDTCLARPATKMPDLIVIYDAHSGAILRQFSLAATLSQVHADIMIEPRFGFSGVSWSPDGSKIVVPFYQYYQHYSVLTSNPQAMGILVISAQSGSIRALVGPTHFEPSVTGFYPRYTGATVWNVQSGAQAATVDVPLPAAQDYQWSTDGHITPVQHAPATTTPAPTQASNAEFSYWQPGFVAAVPTNDQSAADPVWFFSTATFTRWSPDSRYVVTGLMTMNQAGRSTGAPTSIAPDNCRDERWPQPCFDQMIPASDAAFQVVLAATKRAAETQGLYPNDALVAWRPDGAVLATVLPGDDVNRAHRAITITLLDTTSGQAVGQVTISDAAGQGNTGMTRWPYVSWSPTGNQLAVVNDIDNTVEVVTIS